MQPSIFSSPQQQQNAAPQHKVALDLHLILGDDTSGEQLAKFNLCFQLKAEKVGLQQFRYNSCAPTLIQTTVPWALIPFCDLISSRRKAARRRQYNISKMGSTDTRATNTTPTYRRCKIGSRGPPTKENCSFSRASDSMGRKESRSYTASTPLKCRTCKICANWSLR